MRAKKPITPVADSSSNTLFPGYPQYPPSEDIFLMGTELEGVDPDELDKRKVLTEKVNSGNEKNFDDDKLGNDLDIPGAELDDEMEAIGSEDEENNFYSLSGYDQIDPAEEKEDEKSI